MAIKTLDFLTASHPSELPVTLLELVVPLQSRVQQAQVLPNGYVAIVDLISLRQCGLSFLESPQLKQFLSKKNSQNFLTCKSTPGVDLHAPDSPFEFPILNNGDDQIHLVKRDSRPEPRFRRRRSVARAEEDF